MKRANQRSYHEQMTACEVSSEIDDDNANREKADGSEWRASQPGLPFALWACPSRVG